MYKVLFLLCPTDCLETIVNNTFRHENYFYASLGNSFVSDTETLRRIKELIIKHDIRSIYFVLSSDNQIILDALGKHFFSKVRGLETFYSDITKYKAYSEVMWLEDGHQTSIISYFLNKKIKELQFELHDLIKQPIKVFGKIYKRDENTFKDIYPDLICMENYRLN